MIYEQVIQRKKTDRQVKPDVAKLIAQVSQKLMLKNVK